MYLAHSKNDAGEPHYLVDAQVCHVAKSFYHFVERRSIVDPRHPPKETASEGSGQDSVWRNAHSLLAMAGYSREHHLHLHRG